MWFSRHLRSNAGVAAAVRAFGRRQRPRTGNLHRTLFHLVDPGADREAHRRQRGLRSTTEVASLGTNRIGQRRTFLADLSMAEIGVVLIVGSVLIGRKDLPVVTKGVGRVVGSIVGHLIQAKKTFTSFSEVSDISNIRQELQEGVAELRSIRQDIYGFDFPDQPNQRTKAPPKAGESLQHAAAVSRSEPHAGGYRSEKPHVSGYQSRNARQEVPQQQPKSHLNLPPVSASSSGSDIMHQVSFQHTWPSSVI
eukprot:INCI10386.2.p1 GENE.INCI10386.2~~INCI10386.2.p1  ORF type:complete len:251 (-),score=29.53 INCI10386.2:71-823(-)